MKNKDQILLTEALNLFECQVLLKTSPEYNKIDLYNQIRAISGVVVITIVHNDYLESKKTKSYEYSLLKLKYTVDKSPIDDIKILGTRILKGDGAAIGKIQGVLQFLPRLKTIRQVKK